ncbi:hypothetical protein L596_015062 [Steinernema carpocapsae]|uniref:DNA replication licensing factor MCM7 n=1 Tax=Steinernema carpocapsae TaxID=34508 RepID=A0A4U5NES8_STECR|nr:hypothetical protein L596_015062 [Steinernema carpocapsae]
MSAKTGDGIADMAAESQKIKDFLLTHHNEDEEAGKVFPYSQQISRLADREQVALYVDLEDVHEFDAELAENVQQNSRRYLQLFSEATDQLIESALGDRAPPVLDAHDAFIFQRVYMEKTQRTQNADGQVVENNDVRKKYPPQLLRRHEVYFKTRASDKVLSVREITAPQVGKLVTLGGIVIRATEVKPMGSVITYTCDTCGCETYQPVSGPSFMPAVNCPSRDCVESKANGRLQMQVRGSKFVKYQELKIQELSEQVPVGSIPRTMTVNVFGENTRHCAPGDQVRISGVFVPLLRSGFRQMAGGLVTDVYLEAHHIENVNNGGESAVDLEEEFTEDEIKIISQDDLYEKLANSIAPEIYGHTNIKKALLLALVGGVDKNADGMKIRGSINVLLMGDPGVAKSQLLTYVDRLAVRSQYTTGRGSSGVGLTAAVLKDPVTGEMTLEGGALVLADRGICCIDEFDKMMDSDRTAIHEVMEQQTISVAKAGIMTTLNARVAIIAAANPAFGRYNPKRSIEENVHLPAALLSRFDLLFLIQDKPDREADKKLAEHITYVHREGHEPEKEGFEPINMTLFRKYIAVCKRKNPVVDHKLSQKLVEMYVELRKEARNNSDSIFTSPRILLGAIRLATGLARLRLSDNVNLNDIEEALRLMEAAKISLRPERNAPTHRIQTPMDQAFAIIRDLYVSGGEEPLPVASIMVRCAAKAIPEDAVNSCLQTYQDNGVFLVDQQRRVIFA